MLKLSQIVKIYLAGDTAVTALNGIDLEFNRNEFVSVLGPSGCGKTTLLNIIGGLDRYTTGDLIINGKSTADFSDSDWDSYRNNSVGFVFQNYNLIPHLNVLENVELALTLSGVPDRERKAKAKEALTKVGLLDQIKKRPNQLSGGQMQRVAIARALVNDPDIVLADEPTGALDSGTSEQIMELLKKISEERLIIMVTHNGEIARKYSSRIIRMLDGKIISDDSPEKEETVPLPEKVFDMKKSSMSFWTSLKLSFKNLITKRARTILTSFAGSIGIIGIALVLAISSGFSNQISRMETDTLAAFPLSVEDGPTFGGVEFGPDMEDMFRQKPTTPEFPDNENIIVYNDNINLNLHTNVLNDEYINYIESMDSELYNEISYSRSVSMRLISKVGDGEALEIDNGDAGWQEIISNYDFLNTQYDVLKGKLPENKFQMVLIVDSYNRLTTRIVRELGFDTQNTEEISFDDIMELRIKLVPNDVYYKFDVDADKYTVSATPEELYNNPGCDTLEIVGILRIKESASSSMMGNGLAYSTELTDYVTDVSKDSAVALAQIEDKNRDVISGDYFDQLQREEQYQKRLKRLGVNTTPNAIYIYPSNIANKEKIKEYLDNYNNGKDEAAKIFYMDITDIITSTMGTIINGITYVLVAFAAISLVVSSIMIGIITYISVLERTKEIGVLRSLGARKKDISRVFNAETLIIGFTAGFMGVVIAALLTIPINIVITRLVTQFDRIASLQFIHAVILVLISMTLTLIAGLIPSRLAAKKDPVIALRTE